MSLETQYNLRSPGVKRLMREALELAEPTEEYYACPLEDNLFEWHFTVKGPRTTDFEGGYYHGRILLPSQYPMKPPNIILLTPNGRFETNKKICLSISGHHPESWQPCWSIRTALLALIAFMPTSSTGTIGSIDYSPQERQCLARKSVNWTCDICGKISEKLLHGNASTKELTAEENDLVGNIAFKAEEDMPKKQEVSEDFDINESNFEEVDDDSNFVRQRMPNAPLVLEDGSPLNEVTPSGNNSSNYEDRFWSAAIWIIVSLIAFLIIRRIFILY